MSLIPHSFFPRSQFDMDLWVNPLRNMHSTLDLFDPFDELDHHLSRNLQWFNKPEFFAPFSMGPFVPQKYRITVNCVGFSSDSVSTEIDGNKLYVKGHQEEKGNGDDYSTREFKKSYDLPARCETHKLVSFMTSPGHLVIEIPLKEQGMHLNTDLFPKIVDDADGKKRVKLDFQVPDHVHPEKVNIHVKDRDLIVQAEDKTENKDNMSKFYYYKRTTLPENTDFDKLKCSMKDHRINIEAPVDATRRPYKTIPIEHKPSKN